MRRYQRSNPVPLQKAPTLILTNYINHESKWKFITLQIHLQILPIVAETELNSTKSSKSSDKACRFQAPVAFGPNTCRFQRLSGREWWVVKVGCCLCWCAVILDYTSCRYLYSWRFKGVQTESVLLFSPRYTTSDLHEKPIVPKPTVQKCRLNTTSRNFASSKKSWVSHHRI